MPEINKLNLHVGTAIKDGMARKGLKQKELAALVGSTQRSISSYVTGKTQPPLDILINICIVLEIDLKQILSLPEFQYPHRVIKDQDELEYVALLDDLASNEKKDFIFAVKQMRKLIK